MYEGKSLTLVRLNSGIGHLRFDLQKSSVNKFNRLTLQELEDAVAVVTASDLPGLICSSGKDSFIVGADIGEFTTLFRMPAVELQRWARRCNAIFSALEDLAIPTVSIIDGVALGGGFELCLATDYRIASARGRFGFPEVGLGICPGFGGTVRAPRVMDPTRAVEWISGGRQYSAERALSVGAIDELVDSDNLMEAAEAFIRFAGADANHLLALRETKRDPVSPLEEYRQALDNARELLVEDGGKAGRATVSANPAPLRALQLLAEAADKTRDDALALEHDAFAELASSPVAANLAQVFINEQWLRGRTRELAAGARPVQHAAVLGAGIMGGGIAYQSALRNVPVIMKDIAQPGLDAGLAEASRQLSKLVEKGRLTEDAAAATLARIQPTLSYEGWEAVDLLIEAVVENPQVKKSVLAEVERQVSPDTVLTSNTSTISITSLAGALERPQNFCGMHFFNPVPVMPLVEVIRGASSSDSAIATTVAFALALGKTPIVVNDCPGFLVNRILFPYFGAFSMLVRDGADIRDIDAAMEAFGWPMGPAFLLDVVGIDTAVHAQAVMAAGFPERMDYGFTSPMQILFEAGHFGQKSGAGFYRYQPQAEGRPAKVVDEEQLALVAQARQNQPRQQQPGPDEARSAGSFSAKEIVERMMLAMCLESVRCLEDGIVSSPMEVDMGLVLGLGFPSFRGGALRHIDAMGAKRFCELAARYEALGPLYQPTAKLLEMAASGDRFYE